MVQDELVGISHAAHNLHFSRHPRRIGGSASASSGWWPVRRPVFDHRETGTGKNTVAELIHHMHQERRQHHFRRTNLGALVPELAASQLFGQSRALHRCGERLAGNCG